ncbi:hypothetical protein AQ490_20225 [Wenjunlia vitaminophila]|uniref:Transferase n=1 Tax=Wenjunlia vitaminophila TaxID=76728 RepID=A0A0T6LUA8_WENVI|nr:hypothetical protein AQ490_20225 [Wenjunlia vitaminophila]
MVDGPRATSTVDDAGRIVLFLQYPDATEPRLCLRRRPKKGEEESGQPIEVELTRTDDPAGHWRAVLPPEPLAEGRWDLYLLPDPDATVRQQIKAGINDVRALVDRRPARSGPVAVRTPYPTKTGHLAIRAWLRPVHAEAGDLQVGQDALEVRAQMFGRSLGPGAVAVARCRPQRAITVEAPVVPLEDGRFSFTLAYQELLDARADITAVWDLLVRPEREAELVRIGRLLDDVADKKSVFVYPTRQFDEGTLRPYFTLDNDLSIEVGLVSES